MPESSKLDNVMLDVIYDEAFGKKKPSCVRAFGSGPTTAQLYESISQQSATQIKHLKMKLVPVSIWDLLR